MTSDHSTYVSDAPLSDPKHDKFNRLSFAKRIAETISARADPSSLVIAIYGAWGNGKTTVLNFIEKELRSLSGVIVLSFNPWRFPTERSLLRYFFTSLAKSLESTLTTSAEEIRTTLPKYGELIQIFCSGAGEAPNPREEALAATDLEEQKRKIATILARNEKKVVVLIDDIDRLDESAMQAVFRLAKLTADFENTVYVLAFDAEMAASVIGERFTASRGRRLQAGHDFLEKIVQVPLDLPTVPAEALQRFSFDAINEALNAARVEITESETSQFVKHFHEGLEIRLKTPRMAKRFGNVLAFSLAINKGEVNTVEMMLVEGIRLFYPNAYAVIKRSKGILGSSGIINGVDHDREQSVQQFLSAAMEGLTTGEASALRQLLVALFPRIVGRTRYGSQAEEEWAKTRRVTSERYFDRYFSYAIPSKDIADDDVQEFVSKLERSQLDDTSSCLNKLITRENAGVVITKLSAIKDRLSPRGAEKLALALSRNGNLFPNSEGLVFFTQPFAQAGTLISDLLERIPRSARPDVAYRIVAEAEPIRLAIEAVNWITSGNDPARTGNPNLPENECKRLWELLTARIEAFALEQAPSAFLAAARETASCLSVWAEHGNNASLREYVTRAIRTNPQNAVSLIEGCLPATRRGIGTCLGDLTRATYDTVAKMIDVESVLSALRSATGESLENPTYHGEFSRPLAITIAHQFAFIHNAVLAE